jgi:hypothetical protein
MGQNGQRLGNSWANWAFCTMAGGRITKFGGQKRWSDKLPQWKVRMNFPIIPHIPKMGIWGIFNLSGKSI